MSSTPLDRGAEILARIIRPEKGDMTADAAQSILTFQLPPEDRDAVNQLAAKARDGSLTPDERSLLDDYERVTMLLELMQSKARQSLKQAALERTGNLLGKAAENMKDVSEEEFNEALDEAMDHVRKREG